jgi:hypothetical protein
VKRVDALRLDLRGMRSSMGAWKGCARNWVGMVRGGGSKGEGRWQSLRSELKCQLRRLWSTRGGWTPNTSASIVGGRGRAACLVVKKSSGGPAEVGVEAAATSSFSIAEAWAYDSRQRRSAFISS